MPLLKKNATMGKLPPQQYARPGTKVEERIQPREKEKKVRESHFLAIRITSKS